MQNEIITYGDFPILGGETISDGALGQLDGLDEEVVVRWVNRRDDLRKAGYEKSKKIKGYFAMFCEEVRYARDGDLATASVRCVGLVGNELNPKMLGRLRCKRTISCAGQQVSVGPVKKMILAWSEQEKAVRPADRQGTKSESNTPAKPDEKNKLERVYRRVPDVNQYGEEIEKSIVTPDGIGTRWSIFDALLTVKDVYFATQMPDTRLVGKASEPPEPPDPPEWRWQNWGEDSRVASPRGWVLTSRQIDPLFDTPSGGLFAVTDDYSFYHPFTPE